MTFLLTLKRLRTAGALMCALATFLAAPSAQTAANDVYETLTAGVPVTFSVSADGNPAPSFQWMKDGVNIPGATGSDFTISSPTTAHNGVYNVLATNSAGWALSHDLILTVTSAASSNVAPTFTLQPYPSASAPEGSSLSLSAQAVGTPTPDYQWRKNGVPIAGATRSILTFASLTTSDSATYSVVAKNSAGSATSQNSVVTVTQPIPSTTAAPVFTTQPLSQSARLKSTIHFKVSATGSPTYQWYKNGVAIPGATGSGYTIIGVATSHAGTYTVVATNSAGSVTSNGAVLTTFLR